MSTIVKDTTALSDSVVGTVAELSEADLPVSSHEQVFTTFALVVIVISVAVVILAYIVKQALLAWRDGERAYRANESSQQRSNELLDKYIDLLDKKNEQGKYGSDQYRETLARLVELSQKGKLSEITEESLNSIFEKADGQSRQNDEEKE